MGVLCLRNEMLRWERNEGNFGRRPKRAGCEDDRDEVTTRQGRHCIGESEEASSLWGTPSCRGGAGGRIQDVASSTSMKSRS